MKAFTRRAARLFFGLMVLIVVLFLMKDRLLKFIFERRAYAMTGLRVTIERLEASKFGHQFHLENTTIYNAAEFGGAPMIVLPELTAQLDANALRGGKLRANLLRLHIAELNVVTSRDGRTNVAELLNRWRRVADTARGAPAFPRDGFAGIDTLDLTFSRLNYLNLSDSNQTHRFEMGLTNEVFKGVTSIDDVIARLLQVMLRRGISVQSGPDGWRFDLLSRLSSLTATTNGAPTQETSEPRSNIIVPAVP